MASAQNDHFSEDEGSLSISRETIRGEKRRSKCRSRVWEKVMWFTKKAKGGKDNKNSSDISFNSPDVGNSEWSVDNEKAKTKVLNSMTLRYLKRKKVRRFANELGPGGDEEEVNILECGTATGTFHDFQSERRISRLELVRGTSNNNCLFSEMAKEMNPTHHKSKGNVKSVLSLPGNDSSFERSRDDHLCTSPLFHQVRRCFSFSGPCENTLKKRLYDDDISSYDLSLPPSKQKCLPKLRKRATFSGFDSCRIHLRSHSVAFKIVQSTPHLPSTQVNQIKNQNGLTIGAIHFYKSSAAYQKKQSSKKSSQEIVAFSNGEALEHSTEANSVIPIEHLLAKNEEKRVPIALVENDGFCCDALTCVPGKCKLNVVSDDKNCCDIDADKDINSSHTKRSCGQNSTISAFLLKGEFSSSCIAASPDSSEENLAKDTIITSCQTKTKGLNPSRDGSFSSGISCPNLASNVDHKMELDNCIDCGSCCKPKDFTESVSKLVEFKADHSSFGSMQNVFLNKSSTQIPCEEELSHDNIKNRVTSCTEDGAKNPKQSPDKIRKDNIAHEFPKVLSELQTSPLAKGIPLSVKPAVDGVQFKKKAGVMLQWFQEFNDEQKNVLIRRLLEQCGVPQMHMLSVAMEPILHKSCPPNCQDMLGWLPHPVALYVLSFLDCVSLCHCSQVNRTWNNLAKSPSLWKSLCGQLDWQLSRIGEEKEQRHYTLDGGTVQWKKMFASRFLLHQNWLKGKCNVRTLEGHTQGISCVQFDDTRIASGSYDKTIRVWDIKSNESDVVLTLAGHSGTVRCLDLNGNRLVSGSVDRSIKVWDLSFKSYWSGASCKVTMIGHMHTVRCLQVDDEKVVSGSYDKTLKVWDIKTGDCKLTLRGHNAAVLCVQFDDRKIVSGSYDKTIKVWSLAEGSCLMTLTGHHDAVTCLNLTFDSRKVISGSLDHNLKFWDLLNGKCIGTLDWIRSEGHTGVIRCLQTDSWRIVSAGDDKTLKMWSLESGQRLLTLRCHTDGVTCLQFNDYSIVSGSYDKTVKLWDFTPSHDFLNPG